MQCVCVCVSLQLQRCMALEKKLKTLDQQMAMDPRYITRVRVATIPGSSPAIGNASQVPSLSKSFYISSCFSEQSGPCVFHVFFSLPTYLVLYIHVCT